MAEQEQRTDLTEEELERLAAEALPDREAMTILDPGRAVFVPGPPAMSIDPPPEDVS
jgi:hypothetical protein